MLTKPATKPKAKKPAARIINKKPENQTALVYGTYFGKHNNNDITIIQGQNYEENILLFCLTNAQNKEIAEMIVEMVPFEKYNFIYYKPILGNLIMNLFDQLQIGTGYVAENEYIDYLEENIKGYKLNNKLIIEENIKEIPKSVYGGVAILQLDPIVNLDNPETFTVNDILLDDLLDELSLITSLIVLILPKDVEIEYEGMIFPKLTSPANVGFLVNQEGIKMGEKMGLKIRKNDKQSEDLWYVGLAEHLKKLFTKLKIKNIDEMFDNKYRKIWADVFTHESFDKKNNYEEHETRGDFVLKGVFGTFLCLSMPNANKNEITMFFQAFMSKHFQPQLTKDLGIEKFIRSNKKIDDKMLEDIFESFISGYFTVSIDTTGGVEKAYGRIHHLIEYLFNKVEKIDFNNIRKGELKLASMVLKQRLEALRFKYYEKVDTVEGGTQVLISTDNNALEYFRKRGKNVTRIIGRGFSSGGNKDAASKMAYEDAVLYLDKQGISDEWVKEEKEKLNKLDPIVEHLEEQLVKKKKLQKYLNIYHKVDPASCTIMLYGIDNHHNHNLIAEINDCDINKGILHLYEEFLAS